MKNPLPRTNLFDTVVPLGSLPVDPSVAAVKARYEHEFGPSPDDLGGWYRSHDWQRISFVLGALRPGGRFLDVGLGAGQFVNAVAMDGRFGEVHGSDPFRFKKYLEFGGEIARVDAGVEALPYPDQHFDVVTCMEVLEHIPDEVFASGLQELRRVCCGQLVLSVPFEEREPIYEGHRRRFTANDLGDLFPLAERVLLYRAINPWALLEEWRGARPQLESSLLRASRNANSSLTSMERARFEVGRRAAPLVRATMGVVRR